MLSRDGDIATAVMEVTRRDEEDVLLDRMVGRG